MAASQLYQDQHGTEMEQAISGPLRYHNVCVLWIQCQPEVLNKRLDDRVDDMMSRGLIKELEEFHHSYNKDRLTNHSKVEYQLGIFQNIGFKEFHDYLILPEEEKCTEQGKQLLEQGVDDMKRATRKYAKKQVRWVTNRFLKRPDPDACPVYALSGTDITRWEENVGSPALEIVSSIIEGRIPSQEPLPLEPNGKNPAVHNVCDACGGKVFLTLADWTRHRNSKRHRNTVMKKRREEQELLRNER
ncbi:tRNA dimethylallyltransferase-like isoform X2 [Liolophura sinensis]